MKALHIVARLAEGGGITEATLGLTRALTERGAWACGILTLTENGLAPYAERCQEAGVRLHTVEAGWHHTLWYSRDWVSQLGRIAPEYDLIHIHGLWLYPLLATAAWCLRHGVPFVVSPHGGLLPPALAQSRWKKRALAPLVRHLYRRAGCIHATSEAELQSVRNYWKHQAPSVVCLAEGVDLREVRRRQRAQSATKSVTYLGRVSPEKDLDALVHAWKRLPDGLRKGWRLRLIGFLPEGQSRYADEVAKTCRAAPAVTAESFCGTDQKWDALAESDLLVLPSRHENFGIVVAEALAAGVPVIATQGTPWKDLLGSSEDADVHPRAEGAEAARIGECGRCGWWIERGESAVLAALKEALRLTDEQRARMGENGRHLVERKYQWTQVAQEMEKAYERCVGMRASTRKGSQNLPGARGEN